MRSCITKNYIDTLYVVEQDEKLNREALQPSKSQGSKNFCLYIICHLQHFMLVNVSNTTLQTPASLFGQCHCEKVSTIPSMSIWSFFTRKKV